MWGTFDSKDYNLKNLKYLTTAAITETTTFFSRDIFGDRNMDNLYYKQFLYML